MTITITANDANRDGKGINFAAYLATYRRKFERDGYGEFNDDIMSGSQYATKDASGWGVVLTAGATRWEYDLSTHVVSGSIAKVTFGTSVELNTATEKFTYALDLDISGLGVSDKNVGGGILSELMNARTNALEARLELDDILFRGSTGADVFSGYKFNDRLSGNGGNDTLRGGAGNDRINGGAGNDRLFGDAGNDRLNGAAGNDRLDGGRGNDVVNGAAGNDVLNGGVGNDRLNGGAGNDTLTGGTGNDVLTGGAGKDMFVFVKNGGADTVTDFDAGAARTDVLKLDNAVLKNFSAVLAHAEDVAAGVMIDYGNGSILLKGVDVNDLHANDFFFF